FAGEAFMLREPAPYHGLPGDFVPARSSQCPPFLPHAATLAQLWLDHPELPLWKPRRRIYTGDFDSQGQRVYVMINDAGKFEIHRDLDSTQNEWGYAEWL